MKHKFLVVAATVGVIGLAYAATALAHASRTATANEWSALRTKSARPITPITGQALTSISALIASHGGDTLFSITPGSYANAQELASTSAGKLYLIVGGNGVCLAFTSAVSCSNQAGNGGIIAALTTTDPQGELEGGGVVASGVSSVTIGGGARSITKATTEDAFTIGSADNVAVDGATQLRLEGSA